MSISAVRAIAEITAVFAVSFAAMIAIALAVSPYAGPLGMLAGAGLAVAFVRLRGEPLAEIGLRRAGLAASAAVTAGLVIFALVMFVYVEPALERRFGPIDLSAFDPLAGNAPLYALMLAMSWTGAAVGEEVVYRGFAMTRIAQVFSGAPAGWAAAILVQAALFGLAHGYQATVGMIEVFAFGMVAGAAYLAAGRSLAPLIIAHGVIDTLAMTDFYLGMAVTDWLRAAA